MAVRGELKMGLLVFALTLTAKQFWLLPEFLSGLLLGFGLCMLLIGALPPKGYRRLKAWKARLQGRMRGT
ncbi:hypothetical protein H8699_02735 [Christensenellaceae bacterium NSJ-44]|uniref:Uncharacterized protein n=1 Tax=Luoshenia tenuis TaxID=2763654 RepID=A0A926CYL7_9FIRM|nr:hypothetical protein [Luoshenia tenuis]MBC8528354.1 hypothetical protein [Luoshenia tenuis]